jgi:hypothetical protein
MAFLSRRKSVYVCLTRIGHVCLNRFFLRDFYNGVCLNRFFGDVHATSVIKFVHMRAVACADRFMRWKESILATMVVGERPRIAATALKNSDSEFCVSTRSNESLV